MTKDAERIPKKVLILRVVDNKWTDYIDALDQLRNAVGLRGYAQTTPWWISSRRFRMFNDMIDRLNSMHPLDDEHNHEQERNRRLDTISVQLWLVLSQRSRQGLPEDLDLSQIDEHSMPMDQVRIQEPSAVRQYEIRYRRILPGKIIFCLRPLYMRWIMV